MDALKDILVGGFAITVMLSVGVDLTLSRLRAVFRRPLALTVALAINHLVIPAVALGIIALFALPPAVATGLLLVAAAPGGPIGAMLTQRSQGDLAFAASLLVVMTVLNTATTPLTLSLAQGAAVELGHVPAMARTIVVFLLLPLGAGVVFRHLRPGPATRALKWLKLASNVLFGLLFVALVLTRGELALQVGATPLAAMALLVAVSVGAGWAAGLGGRPVRLALALTTCVRNFSLSLLLATLWFDDPTTLLTVMVYGLVAITAGLVVTIATRVRRS